jgi:hypothetical protein
MKTWYKTAAEWFKMEPTITLYHGTNERNLRKIQEEGFKSFKPKSFVDEILGRYGMTRADVPDYIWQSELNYRKQNPNIHFTTSRSQAQAYAEGAAYGGEFETNVVKLLRDWMKEEKGIDIEVPEERPVVITVNLPWDYVKTHKSMDELKQVVSNVVNNQENLLDEWQTLEEFLSDVAYVFIAQEEIPPDYIVNTEFLE